MKNNYFFIFIIGFSSIIGGIINYFYYPLMLKFLTLEEFGIFSSLIGIFNILGVFIAGIDLFLNKKFNQNSGDNEKNKQLLLDSLKIFGIIGIFSFLIFSLFSPVLANFLKINDIFLVIFVGIVVIYSYFATPLSPFLKAFKKFEIISFGTIIGPLLKLFFGILLLFLGLKIYGAIGGFIISGFFLTCYFYYFSYKNLKNINYISNVRGIIKDFYENKIEILNFFLVAFLFSFFMNLDILFARNLFSEFDAGIYAGISVLGKFLLFLSLSIETVYFGQIMEYKREKLPFHLIKNPILIIIIIISISLIFNYFFGKIILGILNKNFIEFESTYLLILIYYGFLALISFFIKIMIGWKIYKINILLLFFTIILIYSLYNFGNNLFNYSLIFAIFGVLSSLILAILFFYNYKLGKKSF